MKKTISFKVFIRNTIILSMFLIILLFVLYGKFIQSSSIEKSIKNDSGVMADLIFQNLFTAMKSGASKEDIHAIVANLEKSITHVNILLLDENAQEHTSILQTVYATKQSDIEQHGDHVLFAKPILYEEKCLQCHTTKEVDAVAKVMIIEFPIFNLQISLREIVLLATTLLLIIMVVFFSSWYYFLKKYFVVPVRQLATQIEQVSNHDDLENVYINTSLKELKQIEDVFNKQNKKLVQSYQQLKDISDTDTLTGIFNRKKFDEYSKILINHEKRYEHGFSLVVIDLNFFKQINDTHGHDVGDDILILFTQLVSKVIRESDYLFRTGGDEFILLLPETSKEDTLTIIDKIDKTFEENRYVKESIDLRIHASFGAVAFPMDGETIKDLIKKADIYMYEDKKRRKANRV